MSDIVDRLRASLEGHYEIEREIGEGGMATVYLARELAATMGPDRFLQEVRVAANLQHPHILPLFDSGEADGFLFRRSFAHSQIFSVSVAELLAGK